MKTRNVLPGIVVLATLATTASLASTAVPQTLPYGQNFGAGLPTATEGWEYYRQGRGIVQVSRGWLRLWSYGGDDNDPGYGLSEAILHVDLTGKNAIHLTLDHRSQGHEHLDLLPDHFTSHHNGDGIALSVDGTYWVDLHFMAFNQIIGRTYLLDWALDEACQDAGTTNVSDVQIKFQRYGPGSLEDAWVFDNIEITAGDAIPQAVPYRQTFTPDLPTTIAGWEYYSSTLGTIHVVGGRLEMAHEYPGGNDAGNSYNEAILHVDLTGRNDLLLQLDHWNVGDDDHTLPASFTDRCLGDGVALSVDGIHWVRVTDLNSSFTGRVFRLDAALALAKTYAGATDVSDARIKFQQVGGGTYKARQLDNIRITERFAPVAWKPGTVQNGGSLRDLGDKP